MNDQCTDGFEESNNVSLKIYTGTAKLNGELWGESLHGERC